MGNALRTAGGTGAKAKLCFGTAFNISDSSQQLISDSYFETYSNKFTVSDGATSLVCNTAGTYIVHYTANGSYVTASILQNGSAVFSKAFAVRGPRVSGSVSLDLEAGDLITSAVSAAIAHAGTISFWITTG